ncbi:glycosyltransferase [Pirellulales bacterium]|nr:glycosyltransferase [Pirellulales bacterium]
MFESVAELAGVTSEAGVGFDAVVAPAARVLHVINGEHYAGAERVQDLLSERLPHFGYEVGLVAVKPGRFRSVRSCHDAPLIDLPMRSRFDRSCGRRLARLVRDSRCELLHAHTPRTLSVASQAARMTGVPLVYHVHSPASRDSTRRLANLANQWTERRLARKAARLVAVSPSVRQHMLDLGFAAEHVTYIPNGVPAIDALPRTQTPETWTLGMFALFRPRKGVEVLLEALARLRDQGANVRLRAVGPFETPQYEADVQGLAKQLKLCEAIQWTGFVQDIAGELAQIDVSVLPSLFGEGLPMTVLESMAAGVPVAASDVEGAGEAIRHGQEGLLAPPGDAAALAESLESLFRGEYDYVAMSKAAQMRQQTLFSAAAMSSSVAAVYDCVTADL